MRLLIDTDVLLDFAIGREPYFQASKEILNWGNHHPRQCAVAWHSLANLNYLIKSGAASFISDLLEFVEVPRTGTQEMRYALNLKFSDLEDAMQVSAGMLFGAQIIVSRNVKHYRKSPIRVMSPIEILPLLA